MTPGLLAAETAPLPHNLPHFLTAFIGRAADIAQVKKELAATRLLTLTGPGGGGKTRLALQVTAEVMPEFRDGAWWCDLAGVTDPAYVAQTISSVLRLPEPADQPALDRLTTTLLSQQALLVLDNCEHLLAACAALSLAILRACPGVRILATSLQPLGLPQERVWTVPPLSLTVPAQAEATAAFESDAVRLFVDRATRAAPSFRLTPENRPAVVTICRQLDGLPLALELAAARVRLLTADQIAERLGDALGLLTRGSLSHLPRHQTLRLAIDWSYHFLSSSEQGLLRRLAVFAGPFTLAMVEAVCGDQAGAAGVLDGLDGLADKSFVVLLPREAGGEVHCRLLEVIRQYARAGLEESGEAARIRDHYLNWAIDWAELAADQLTGPARGAWLAHFEAKQEHCRAALRWACTSHQAEAGLRLASAMGPYWMASGLSEGRAWLEEILAVTAERAADTPGAPPVLAVVHARGLLYSGRLAVRQGDPAHGLRRGQQSLTLFRVAGNVRGCLSALNLLALAAQDRNDYERAEASYAEGLTLSRQSHDERMTAVLLVNHGLMYYEQQDYRRVAPIWDEAYALIERLNDYSIASRDNLACLAMMQGRLALAHDLLERERRRLGQAGDPFALAILMMDLGEVARRQGDFDRAQAWLREALERQRQLGDRLHMGETLANLGRLALNQGELQAARACCEQSLASLADIGYTRLTSQVKICLGLLAAAQGHAEAALALFREGLQMALEGQHQLSRVEALEGIAGLLIERGDPQRAARWLAVTETARETLGAPIPPIERARYDQLHQQLRQALGAERYAAARAQAAELSPEQLDLEVLGQRHSRSTAAAAVPDGAELRVLALGPTRVLVNQRTLKQSDWTYAKSKELLFFLLTRGPASKSQIGLDLWPDASPAQLRASFHSALRHLRQALVRPEWIVYATGEYSINGDRPLDYDVRSFEEHLRQAQATIRAASLPAGHSGAIAHLEAAVALWRGDFLADTAAGDWAVFEREALRRAFFDGLLQLADLRFADAHYPAAAAAYRQALQLDGYLELAHRGLMRCYARQGEAGQAVRHYQALRQLLRQELSAAPSSETTLLYDRIRRGDDT